MKKHTSKLSWPSNQEGFGHIETFIALIVIVVVGYIGVRVLSTGHAATTSTTCIPSATLVNPCRPLYGTVPTHQTPYPQVASDQVSQMLYQDKRIGHTSDIAHLFNSPGNNTIPADGITLINKGYTLMLNWKPASPWVNGYNGNDRASVDAMAASLKAVAPHKVLLVIWHEPGNDVTPGEADCTVSKGAQGSAADYVKMWQYTVTRLRADGVSNAVYVEYFQNYPPLNCNAINQLYAGDKYVDWIGFDAYASYGSYADNTWNTVVSRLYSFFSTNSNSSHNYLSKPWMISEFGVSHFSVADQESWYSQAAGDITNNTYPNLKAYVDYDDNNPSTGVAENRQAYNDTGQFVQAKQDAYNAIPNAIFAQQAPPNTTHKLTPTVVVTAPANGATVSATVKVTGTGQNISGLKYVSLRIDNTFNQGSASGSYSFSLNTTKLSNGKHTLLLRAWNKANQSTDAKAITITVHN